MNRTPQENAKLDVMEELHMTETEYEENKKDIERTVYFNGRVLHHAVNDLWSAIKKVFKR